MKNKIKFIYTDCNGEVISVLINYENHNSIPRKEEFVVIDDIKYIVKDVVWEYGKPYKTFSWKGILSLFSSLIMVRIYLLKTN